MSEPIPVKETNTAATVALASAAVGFWILPIILGPLAIVAGCVALQSDARRGAAWTAIIIGVLEICYMFVQWASAGLFG